MSSTLEQLSVKLLELQQLQELAQQDAAQRGGGVVVGEVTVWHALNPATLISVPVVELADYNSLLLEVGDLEVALLAVSAALKQQTENYLKLLRQFSDDMR